MVPASTSLCQKAWVRDPFSKSNHQAWPDRAPVQQRSIQMLQCVQHQSPALEQILGRNTLKFVDMYVYVCFFCAGAACCWLYLVDAWNRFRFIYTPMVMQSMAVVILICFGFDWYFKSKASDAQKQLVWQHFWSFACWTYRKTRFVCHHLSKVWESYFGFLPNKYMKWSYQHSFPENIGMWLVLFFFKFREINSNRLFSRFIRPCKYSGFQLPFPQLVSESQISEASTDTMFLMFSRWQLFYPKDSLKHFGASWSSAWPNVSCESAWWTRTDGSGAQWC